MMKPFPARLASDALEPTYDLAHVSAARGPARATIRPRVTHAYYRVSGAWGTGRLEAGRNRMSRRRKGRDAQLLSRGPRGGRQRGLVGPAAQGQPGNTAEREPELEAHQEPAAQAGVVRRNSRRHRGFPAPGHRPG